MNDLIESLYIHFPFCDSFCSYCDFYKRKWSSTDATAMLSSYEEELEQMWQKLTALHHRHQQQIAPLKTLYIGGGSPSLWGKRGAVFLKKFLEGNQILLDEACEFTLEVNPRHFEEILPYWQSIGVNRISMGVQSLNQGVMNQLGRKQDFQAVERALVALQASGINFSIDLLLGVNTKDRNLDLEIEQLLSYNPSHLSAYILTPKGTCYKYPLPPEEEIRKEYLHLSLLLTQQGFVHYEVSNFAKKGKESQHNLQYWRHNCVAALGHSASGMVGNHRYKWSQKQFKLEKLGEEEIYLERLYLRLRTNLGLSLEEFFRGKVQQEKMQELLLEWEKRRYLKASSPLLCLSPLGYLMLDSLMDELFVRVLR
ncbi:MAG: coproporphyrinogen III oxidase family protein [Oligoflexia bacterium]|nr:coproporphyrinogen III oxidase family protein [Oligoflexia bacterium]